MSGAERSFAVTVRRLLRTCDRAALGTLLAGPDGGPYVSLVMVASAPDGSPLLYLSRLAEHTRNLLADARVALLYDATAGLEVPLAGTRATVLGRAQPVDDMELLDRYIRYHPDAAGYRELGDFRLWRVGIARAHLVAGFGRIGWVEGRELLLEEEKWRGLAAVEKEAVAHTNTDHADAVELLAVRLLGREGGPWRVAGLDPEGLDLLCGRKRARLEFPQPVTDAQTLRATLVALVRQARASGG
jgi:putative heme iron utilization protein